MLRAERGFYPKFFRYVTLSMLSVAGVSLYVLADTFFISRGVGTFGIAALNLLLPAFSLVNAIGLMFGMGAATRYKIRVAEGRKRDADRSFSKAFFASAALSVVFVILGFTIPEKISVLLGGDADTLPYMASYLKTIWAFAPLFMLNNVLVAVTRNDNRPGLAMGVMLSGSLLNVVLDWVFIFPMQLGMFGAALATGIAPAFSIAVLFAARLFKKNTYRLVNPFGAPKEYIDLVKLGFSSFVNEMSNGIVVIAFNFILLSVAGNVGVAAYGIITNLSWVAVGLLNGIGQGTQPLIAEAHGRGDGTYAGRTLRTGIFFGLAVSAILYAVFAVFRIPIVALFNSEGNAALAKIAEEGFAVYFIGMIPASFVFLAATYFNSIERPFAASVLSLSRGLFVIVPAAFLLSKTFGLLGVWASSPATEAFTALLACAFLVFKRKSAAFGATDALKSDCFPPGLLNTLTVTGLPDEARTIRRSVFVDELGKTGEFDEFDDVATHALVRVGETSAATGRLFYENYAWKIGRVAVLKRYRGKGFGTETVKALEEAARDAGAEEVGILAERDAVGFYRALGYKAEAGVERSAGKEVIPMRKRFK